MYEIILRFAIIMNEISPSYIQNTNSGFTYLSAYTHAIHPCIYRVFLKIPPAFSSYNFLVYARMNFMQWALLPADMWRERCKTVCWLVSYIISPLSLMHFAYRAVIIITVVIKQERFPPFSSLLLFTHKSCLLEVASWSFR